jgi:hypothetical protein
MTLEQQILAVAEQAAEEAYLNCVGISGAVREAVAEEFGVRCSEAVMSHALAHVRAWIKTLSAAGRRPRTPFWN